MEEKLQELYEQVILELQSIGINMHDSKEIGKIEIHISKRNNKRYGACKQEEPDISTKYVEKINRRKVIKYGKFKKHNIEISPWVMQLNDKIIKNTIIHELIHCIPYCNNHGEQFKKYAKYINKNLVYDISRVRK